MKSSARVDKVMRITLAVVTVFLIASFSPPGQSVSVGAIQPEAKTDMLTGEEGIFWVEATLTDLGFRPTYEWEADAGEILGRADADRILYIAPAEPGPVTITVNVGDGTNQVSTSKTIQVSPRVLPAITKDQIYTVQEGDSLAGIARSLCNHRESDFAAIQYYTNLRCEQDARFDCIEDANFIDTGWNIYLPACDAIAYYWLDQLEVLPDIDWDMPQEQINIAGSSTLFPLTSRVAELFKSLGFDGQITIESFPTQDAVVAFCLGEVDIVNATRPVTDEEWAICHDMGRQPLPFQVGQEALAVVVSDQNDFAEADDPLTPDEVRQILSTATYWSDVKPGWPAEEIERFYPAETTELFTFAVEALFDGDADALATADQVMTWSEDAGELVSGVKDNPNGVAFLSYADYWANQEILQALNVSGQLPGPESVATGAYPLVRPLTLYSSAEVLGDKPQAAAFINFYLRTARHLSGDLYFPPNQVDFGESKATFIQAMGWAPELTAETPVVTPAPVGQGPSIGPITFADGATDDNQPIGAGTSFPEDIAEIHAIFDYTGMSETDIWERYWYQNGEEVGSGSGNWEAGESGTFDLSLSTDGEPLGSGDWELEIYVNGDLAQVGNFVIEAGPVAAPTATPTATPLPGAATYKLAFARWDGGKHNLYTANTAGGGERFIVERAAGPSWSSDGQALYVYGEEGVDQQIREGVTYTWPDAGISNGVLLLYLSAVGEGGLPNAFQHSSWKEGTGRAVDLAPNGSMLAYDATHGGPDRRIYFLGTDENRQYDIEIPGEQPSWSPNSNQIVYRSGRNGKQGIWISNRDDSGPRNISNDGSDAFPAWSPDGRSIAFHRDSGGNVDIYVMNTDGSNVRRLTDAPGPDTLPAWTPDGRIVFRSARSGSWGIYIMNGDGSGQKQIIANADPGPDWTFGKMDVY